MTQTKIINIGIIAALFLALGATKCSKKSTHTALKSKKNSSVRNTSRWFGPKVFKDDEIKTAKKELFTKVKNRNYLKLEELLEDERYRNLAKTAIDKEDNEKSALHFAVESERLDTVELLLDKGNQAMVQILTKNKEGVDLLDCEKQTALHLASIKGHLEVVKTLVKRKAALDLKDKKGDTPLHCAIRYKHTEIAQYLIKKGADVNIKDSVKSMAPLHLAIEMGDKRTTQDLIKKGADVNVKSEKCQSLTPLQTAAMKGYLIIVKALINKKAIVDAETKEGLLTPLQYATFYRHRDVMKALIDAKAAINTQDNLGRTPLHMAGFNGDQEAATLLIGAGAQTDIQDKKGRTPKDYVRFGRQSMIRRSIKKAKPRRSL